MNDASSDISFDSGRRRESAQRHGVRWPRLTFISRRKEMRYRRSRLPGDRALALRIIAVVILVQPLLLMADHLIVKPGYWPLPLAPMRIGFAACSMLFLVFIFRCRRWDRFSLTFAAWALLFCVYLLAAQQTYRNSYALFALFDILILICFYDSVLLPFVPQIAIGLGFTLATALSFIGKDFDNHTEAVLATGYLATNLIGVVFAAERHLFLRVGFSLRRSLQRKSWTLARLAYKDPLTGALNRRSFGEQSDELLRAAQRAEMGGGAVHLIVADLDDFKRINDRHGHDGGDQVLVAFAQLLRRSVRHSDRVYRFGGEEFVVALVGCGVAQAQARVERIIAALNCRGIDLPFLDAAVTASFGLATLRGTESPESALTRADQALYQAKAAGKNRLVMASETQPTALD